MAHSSKSPGQQQQPQQDSDRGKASQPGSRERSPNQQQQDSSQRGSASQDGSKQGSSQSSQQEPYKGSRETTQDDRDRYSGGRSGNE